MAAKKKAKKTAKRGKAKTKTIVKKTKAEKSAKPMKAKTAKSARKAAPTPKVEAHIPRLPE
jgi:hypothetical protein